MSPRDAAATKAGITAELRRQARILDELADRIDTASQALAVTADALDAQPAPLVAVAVPVPSQGSVMVAAERLRAIKEKGHTPDKDRGYTGNELAWAAFTYLERAAQDRLPQDDPSIPHVWPLHRALWKPKKSVIRNLVIAANLIVAEIDRRLEMGETP